MSRKKCIANDSVCVVPITKDGSAQFEVGVTNLRFGIWAPPQYHLAYLAPVPNDINSAVVDIDGTTENLDRLKNQYGFNTISIGVDELLNPWNPSGEPQPLLQAFLDSDWRWDELILGVGRGCQGWVMPSLEAFVALARTLPEYKPPCAVGIDEPFHGTKTTSENGIENTHEQWCWSEHYDKYSKTARRIEVIRDFVHDNIGCPFLVTDYRAAANFGAFTISLENRYDKDLSISDGIIYDGYDTWCLAGPRDCTLPISEWANLRHHINEWEFYFGDPQKKKKIGAWIANSCHTHFYERKGWDRHTGVKPVCNKDYFNTLLDAAVKMKMEYIMLYSGDLAYELMQKIRFQTIYGYEHVESELTEDVFREIMDYRNSNMQLSVFLDNAPGLYLDHCAAFRSLAKAVYWRRMEQYRAAAEKQGIIRYRREKIDTGERLYCVNGPLMNINGVDRIDCENCTEWQRSRNKPANISFCDPASQGRYKGGFKPPPSSSPPLSPVTMQSVAKQRLVNIGAAARAPSVASLAKTQSVIAGVASVALQTNQTFSQQIQDGDNYVPLNKRKYIVLYKSGAIQWVP